MNFGSGLGIRSVSTWLPKTTESIKDEIDSGRIKVDSDDPRIRVVITPRIGPRLIEVMYHDALAAVPASPGRRRSYRRREPSRRRARRPTLVA